MFLLSKLYYQIRLFIHVKHRIIQYRKQYGPSIPCFLSIVISHFAAFIVLCFSPFLPHQFTHVYIDIFFRYNIYIHLFVRLYAYVCTKR